uniref:Uncharacterized protein n=1 Tax=Fusarium begoniae TaxID=48487 RepID=A0A6M4B598_9HYPO|nr:hypothetical protein [Fusarium begoniae]
MKYIKNLKLFFNKLFLPTNLSKIIVIFAAGLLSRYLINEYLDVNVFTEYLSLISITFYSLFATFVVFINELFSFFNINIIPNILINILNSSGIILEYLVVKPFIYIYSNSWGKYYGGSYIRNSKTGLANDSDYTNNSYYSNNNNYTNNNFTNFNNYGNNNEGVGGAWAGNTNSNQGRPFSASTLASQYPPEVQVTEHSRVQTTQMNLNNNSFYTRIAQGNPYSEWSLASTYLNPTGEYSGQQGATFSSQSGYKGDPNLESSLGQHPALRSPDGNYYFRIGSIMEENGVERNFRTPPFNSSDSPSNTNAPFVQPSPESYPSSLYTNDTNHASCIGYASRNPELIRDWNNQVQKGRERIIKNLELGEQNRSTRFHEIANPPLKFKEIPVLKSPTRGEASICMEYHNSKNIKSIFIKYHDIAKRKFFWNIWEKNRDTFGSYEEFKNSFDPGMNIWKEIYKQTKADLSAEVKNLLDDDILKSRHRKPKINPRDIRRISGPSVQNRLNQTNYTKNYLSKTPHRGSRGHK